MTNVMSIRHQIFVSSTYSDLQAERKYVIDELTKVGFIAIGMEQFPATDEDQMGYICPLIDDSDYYVIIIKGKYGSLASDGLGFTEKEFNYAIQTSKPCVAFFYREIEQLRVSDIDQELDKQQKLKAFKEKLLNSRIVKYWSTKEDLAGAVKDTVYDLVRRRPSPGWVRGDNVIDPKVFVELEKLRTENANLIHDLGTSKGTHSLPNDLMQGDDEVRVPFKIGHKDDLVYSTEIPRSRSMTWDQVLEGVVDVLYQEPSEDRIYEVLNKYLTNYIRVRENQVANLEHHFVRSCRFQFEAPGIIVTFARRNEAGLLANIGPSVGEPPLMVCWRFSELGKRYVSRLKAVPKPSVANP